MPASCYFVLNNQKMSALVCSGLGGMAAFSGTPHYVNNPANTAIKNASPIPKGRYYIIGRQSGGRLGWLWDWAKDKASHVQHDQMVCPLPS